MNAVKNEGRMREGLARRVSQRLAVGALGRARPHSQRRSSWLVWALAHLVIQGVPLVLVKGQEAAPGLLCGEERGNLPRELVLVLQYRL